MNKKNIIITTLLLLLLVSSALNIFQYNKKDYNKISNTPQKVINKIANPASVNCINLGGSLEIKKNGTGDEYGLCNFEDNRACEEWTLFRDECPIGGRRTTGFDTETQRYCAWLGGETFAQENAKCTFKDGSICTDEDLFNGKCSKGDSLK